ncbi:MAG: hypothetical protein ACLQDQ_12265 [Myxococcaceae bacterium]
MRTPSLAHTLRTTAAPPEGQDGQAWATARAVLRQEASPAAAEALEEPLLSALLEALVEERLAGPVDVLAASSAKHVAKAARRAQYRLRSAGVATRSPAPKAQVASPPPEAAAELPSLLSPPDGLGEALLLVARPVKGGLALHEVVLSDELGLLAHRELDSSRSAWRRSLREAKGQGLREISLEEARALLAEAYRCNLATRSPLPKGAEEMLRRLEVDPAIAPPPPLPPPEEGDAALALEGASLHQEPELRGWLPPEAELKLLAARVQEVESSPLALSPQQRAVQLDERVRAMAEAFFTPERSQLYARRLWLTADVFSRTGRARAALVARAEARRLFHQAPGLFSRFAEALYAKLVHHPSPAAGPGAAAGAPAKEAPAERRTKGGLILP